MKLPSLNRWLYKMEYKHGSKAIQNLMAIISVGMVIAYIGIMVNPQVYLYLNLDRAALFSGQIWRLFTFIFLPPMSSGIIFTLIGIYFYYFVGSSLENAWGSFKFNIFYLCGVIGMIITALITGSADNFYLNMSLFFAFAILFPETRVMLFFIIPIKVKWLGFFDLALFVFSFITGGLTTRVSIAATVVVFLIFFGSELFTSIQNFFTYRKTRQNFKRNNNQNNNTINFR